MNILKSAFLIYLFIPLLIPEITKASDLEVWGNGEKNLRHFPIASESGLNLSMARNEFEIALFHLPKIDSSQELMALSEMELKWEKADPKINWKASLLGVHLLNKSSYMKSGISEVPEIVVPMHLLNQKGFHIPKSNYPRTPWYLLEFFTLASTNSGEYKGNFHFKLQGKKYLIPISLKVYSYALPSRFDLKTSIGFATWPVLKKHYGEWHSGERELYQKYFDLASDHRIDLHKIYYRFPPFNKKSTSDLLKYHDEHESFFDYWMNLYQGRDSVHAFKWSLTDLPIPEEYKTTVDSKALEYWKALEQSVKKNDLSENTFVYFIDEPKKEQFIKIKQNLKKIRDVAPDLKFLVTHHFSSILANLVDWWCVSYSQWDKMPNPTPQFYQKRLKTNSKEQLWFYTSCNAHGCSGEGENHHEPDFVTDRPSSFIRSFPWLAYYYGAKGILYYDSAYGYTKEGNSPWVDDFNFTGYGEGNLFYPCNPEFCGIKEQFPLVSLRLKILRDGLEDVQIARDAMAKKPELEKGLKDFLKPPRNFPERTELYNTKKTEYLKILD
ncbi:MAG: hypothetical protein ACOYL6_15060 [Bacteriovoracaceae bacterium]